MSKAISSTTGTRELSEQLQAAGLRSKPLQLEGPEDYKLSALTAEEQRQIASEMIQLASAGAREQIQNINKNRDTKELEGLVTKKGSVEQVSLDSIDTELESKKGGLPDYIAALPEDHKLRMLWVDGYRANEDGTLYKMQIDQNDQFLKEELRESKRNRALLWKSAIVLEICLIIFMLWHNKEVREVRKEIVSIVKEKGIPKDDPDSMSTYDRLNQSNWLPDLYRLLEVVKRMPKNHGYFASNVESGTYLEYIKRHDMVFDAGDALTWHSRSIRSPVVQTTLPQPIVIAKHNIKKKPVSHVPDISSNALKYAVNLDLGVKHQMSMGLGLAQKP